MTVENHGKLKKPLDGGKGSRKRPIIDRKSFNENYDRIFSKPTKKRIDTNGFS